MSNSMFEQPVAPGGGINWEDHKGALLLIEPTSFESQVNTRFGSNDAVKANVHVIDGPGAGESYADCLIFPKLLLAQAKGQIGKKILGRLGQGEGKTGQSPPWIFNEASADDITKGEAWVRANAPIVSSAQAPF